MKIAYLLRAKLNTLKINNTSEEEMSKMIEILKLHQ